MNKDILTLLCAVLEERKGASPDKSYTASLFAAGRSKILEKVSEEVAELVVASNSCKSTDIIHETADLWFHTIVLLKYHGLDVTDILAELERRFGLPGLEEKASRMK